MLDHGGDERIIGYANACNQSSLRRDPIDERLRWRIRLLLVADRFIIRRSPPLLRAILAVIVVNCLTNSSALSATSSCWRRLSSRPDPRLCEVDTRIERCHESPRVSQILFMIADALQSYRSPVLL